MRIGMFFILFTTATLFTSFDFLQFSKLGSTARGNRIACMFVKCAPNARFTILHSHGNAVDLGQMSSFYLGLGSRINCNIFSYDYSGYGVSGGRPSEKNLYADIEAAWAEGRLQPEIGRASCRERV